MTSPVASMPTPAIPSSARARRRSAPARSTPSTGTTRWTRTRPCCARAVRSASSSSESAVTLATTSRRVVQRVMLLADKVLLVRLRARAGAGELLPLDGARRLGRDVQYHPVDLADL